MSTGLRTPLPPTIQNVGIYHGRADVLVSEQFLHGANIIAIFKQVRGDAFKPFDSFEPFESLERLSGPFKLLAFHRAVLQITDSRMDDFTIPSNALWPIYP